MAGPENSGVPNGAHIATIVKFVGNNVVHFNVEGYGFVRGKVMNLGSEKLAWFQPGVTCNVVVLDGEVSTIEQP